MYANNEYYLVLHEVIFRTLSLVERRMRYIMLVTIAGKDSETVFDALVRHVCKLPQELNKSEMASGTKWPGANVSPRPLISRVILQSPLSVATRIQRKYERVIEAGICSKAPTCQCIRRPNSMPWRDD